MKKISLFGYGFIGKKYWLDHSEKTIAMYRDGIESETPEILYTISTIHNYHAKEGRPLLDIETNLIHFMRVLSTNKEKFSEDLVFNLISTWFVYGKTKCPAKEDSPCSPTGFYSITARAREQLLISYCETFGLKYRIMRLGNVIGVGDEKISKQKNALQYMIRELAQNREINLYKHGAIRDYIDVRDVSQAIDLVLEKGEANQIFNIANGKGYNVGSLVEIAWQESGYSGKINEIPVPDFHKIVQVESMWMNIEKIRSLGYVQQHDIAQTVRGLVHYYQNENRQNP